MSGDRKICGRCKRDLPASASNRAGAGLQHWCRDYFARRGATHLRQVVASRAKRVAAVKSQTVDYLRAHPCVDCGERDMLVLEFDHVGVKCGQVSKVVFNVSLATLEREIAECEIRCCNCHRRVTAARRALARKAGSTVSVEPP